MFLNNQYLLQDHIVHDPMATTYRGIDTHTLQGVSIIVLRETPGDDQKRAREIVLPYAEAGATWWTESRWSFPPIEELRRRIRQGPPRID